MGSTSSDAESLRHHCDSVRRIQSGARFTLADPDEESRPSLLFTLKSVLEQNRSWQAAAEKLHIHKTSLNYRVRRGGG
jgi:PucR family transcriptional regulator, purine catabolism regulatory protein